MTEPGVEPLKKVTLDDGRVTYYFSEAQARALASIAADRVWWDNTIIRFRRVGLWVAGGLLVLSTLSSWWPWVTRMMQFILPDVPK